MFSFCENGFASRKYNHVIAFYIDSNLINAIYCYGRKTSRIP